MSDSYYMTTCYKPYCDGARSKSNPVLCDDHVLLRKDLRWQKLTEQWQIASIKMKMNSSGAKNWSWADWGL